MPVSTLLSPDVCCRAGVLTLLSVLQEAANTLQRRFANKPDEVWLQSAMYPSCEPAVSAWHLRSCMPHCIWNPFATLLQLLHGSTALGPCQLQTCRLPDAPLQSKVHSCTVTSSHTAAALLWLPMRCILSAFTLCRTDYMNTFHYQTDGWFSQHSANIYETSTETLFVGRQDAMQRQALVPLSGFMREQAASGRGTSMLEVACGTGRLATFVKVGACTLHLHESRLPLGLSPPCFGGFLSEPSITAHPAYHQPNLKGSMQQADPSKGPTVTSGSSDPGRPLLCCQFRHIVLLIVCPAAARPDAVCACYSSRQSISPTSLLRAVSSPLNVRVRSLVRQSSGYPMTDHPHDCAGQLARAGLHSLRPLSLLPARGARQHVPVAPDEAAQAVHGGVARERHPLPAGSSRKPARAG